MSDRQARAMDDIAEAMELLSRKFPDRRERIATAAMQGLLAHHGESIKYPSAVQACSAYAVAYADALIAELDKLEP